MSDLNPSPRPETWWGDFELGPGQVSQWRVGPLELWLGRSSAEWRLFHGWTNEEARDWTFVADSGVPEGHDAERFAVGETSGRARLRPAVADRAVVARPTMPLRVLPGTEARIFLSSPLWVEVGVGESSTVLRDVPTRRLSDTWFGATPRAGELCYALKTNARTVLGDLPRVSYRLMTPVIIDNRAADELLVERINLPVPFLSIYGNEPGELWSEEVRLVRSQEGDMAELEVVPGPPPEAAGAPRLGEPRRRADRGHLFQAFGTLLGLD